MLSLKLDRSTFRGVGGYALSIKADFRIYWKQCHYSGNTVALLDTMARNTHHAERNPKSARTRMLLLGSKTQTKGRNTATGRALVKRLAVRPPEAHFVSFAVLEPASSGTAFSISALQEMNGETCAFQNKDGAARTRSKEVRTFTSQLRKLEKIRD